MTHIRGILIPKKSDKKICMDSSSSLFNSYGQFKLQLRNHLTKNHCRDILTLLPIPSGIKEDLDDFLKICEWMENHVDEKTQEIYLNEKNVSFLKKLLEEIGALGKGWELIEEYERKYIIKGIHIFWSFF